MSRPTRRQTLDALSVTELCPGGDGVAIVEHDGERRAVFLRGVAAGDRVRADVDFAHRPARGRVLEVLSGGTERVVPACAYVARCGGCDWMHVSSKGREAAHVDHLRRALPAAWREQAIRFHPASASLGYRTRARVHARASGGRAIVGMNAARSNEPVEVDACVILDPVIELARQKLASYFDGAHGDGDVQLARSRADRAVLEVRWSGSLPPSFYARMEAAVKAEEIAGARVFSGKTSRPALIGDPTPWMRAGDDLPLELAPGGFAQASEAGNRVLVTRVDALAASALKGDPSHSRIIELYAGAGNLTVLLAKRADTYVAVESDRDGCRAAENNLRTRGLRAKVVEADADSYALPRGTHLVVLDPPRTGARAVAERLASSLIRSVIYVSCDPQTLGRDLAILAPAYRAIEIEAFEMFPQTSHVEAVVLLESTSRDGKKKASVI